MVNAALILSSREEMASAMMAMSVCSRIARLIRFVLDSVGGMRPTMTSNVAMRVSVGGSIEYRCADSSARPGS